MRYSSHLVRFHSHTIIQVVRLDDILPDYHRPRKRAERDAAIREADVERQRVASVRYPASHGIPDSDAYYQIQARREAGWYGAWKGVSLPVFDCFTDNDHTILELWSDLGCRIRSTDIDIEPHDPEWLPYHHVLSLLMRLEDNPSQNPPGQSNLGFATHPDTLRRFAVACGRAHGNPFLLDSERKLSRLWDEVLNMADRIIERRAFPSQVVELVDTITRFDNQAARNAIRGDEGAFDILRRLLSDKFAREDAELMSERCVYGAWSLHFARERFGGRTHELGELLNENGLSEKQLQQLSLQAELAQDIFGNSFQEVVIDFTWRTSTVVSLARSMHESQDFSAMPILGDALQDANCEHEGILNHCRSNGIHVRGCWLLELLLEERDR